VDQVKETAQTVHSAVSNTTDDVRRIWTQVSGGVHDAFDVSHLVKMHPWEALMLAVGVGFFAGFLNRRGSPNKTVSSTGVMSDLIGVLRRELISVGEATIAAGATAIKQNLQSPRPTYASSGDGLHNGRV
jgi:hypothetical protein